MKKKVLVVDDSATARMLFKVCINGKYEVLQSSMWKDALKLAKSEKPFLIVVDYNMPEKVGTELAKLMLSDGVSANFALMTANTQQYVIDEAKELGFIDVLEKPVSVEDVQKLLEKLE